MPALGFSSPIVPPLSPSAARKNSDQRIRFFPAHGRRSPPAIFKQRAAFSSSPSSLGDHDLYDLLGLESSSDQSQIKRAYRALQKQCHPDVAGPAGHDMAIVLNEAYAVLSDPRSRSAYDEERSRQVDFHGFTGKPLYSSWCGPEGERRAVFVDEVRCVGCLKCALFARNTFAIEAVHGRARVVAQWADPEAKILDAIDICPVDCISIVAKSDLPALEFFMSKQPRGPVRMTGGAAAGNIFSDVKKFQRRYSEIKGQTSNVESEESARAAAVRGIKSISYWWFRHSNFAAGSPETRRNLVIFTGKRAGTSSNAKRLQEAAAKMREGGAAKSSSRMPPPHKDGEEYWTPILLPSAPPNPATSASAQSRSEAPRKTKTDRSRPTGEEPARSILPNTPLFRVPELVAAIAAAAVGAEGGGGTVGGGSGGLQQHFAGATALEIVNSAWLQILLAGITWYIVAAAAVGLIVVVTHRKED